VSGCWRNGVVSVSSQALSAMTSEPRDEKQQ
jgi:hypothetical protein